MARQTDRQSPTTRLTRTPTQIKDVITQGRATPRDPATSDAEPVYGMFRARVIDVADPRGVGEVRVELPAALGLDGRSVWCPVLGAGAGDGRGIWFRPEVDDEVVLAFEEGDVERPLVVGGLWRQASATPVDGDADNDLRGLYSRAGSRIEFDDDDSSVTIRTAGGIEVVLRDDGGECRITDTSGGSIVVDGTGVTIETAGKVTISGSTLELSASSLTVDAAVSQFAGLVKADTVQVDTVIASTYTPGAGNVW